jgi:hypothetical protein
MDFIETLRELYAQKEQLGRVIQLLEELQHSLEFSHAGGKRRGRKSMGAAERREVSDRMKRYWAARRRRQDEKPTR